MVYDGGSGMAKADDGMLMIVVVHYLALMAAMVVPAAGKTPQWSPFALARC